MNEPLLTLAALGQTARVRGRRLWDRRLDGQALVLWARLDLIRATEYSTYSMS
jgi:hypothetical protein